MAESMWNCMVVFTLLASGASATLFSLSANFEVVNNADLNGRVKTGDITRYVFLEENTEFALGFQNTGPPSSYVPPGSTFYLSIITKPGGDPSLWNMVWCANREQPVQENATLSLDSSGNLALRDVDGTLVWSSGSSPLPTVAAILDLTGNLQLVDDKNTTVWESFDSPTDSLLPGQYLRTGSALVAAVSVLNTSSYPTQPFDYSAGAFSLAVLPGGIALFENVNTKRITYFIQSVESELHYLDSVLHTCQHPNDLFFNSETGLVIVTDLTKNSTAADPSLCGHGDGPDDTLVIALPGPVEGGTDQQFVRIDPDGVVRLYEYNVNSRAYKVFGSIPPS